jgi:hypothetical protein
MVLAGIDLTYSEAVLSRILGTDEVGTPSFAITQLSVLRLDVEYRTWSITQLTATLDMGQPVIAFVTTNFLDHWEIATAHAVVIVGIETGQRVWIHDPFLPVGPTAVSWDGMLAAWFEFEYRGATLKSQKFSSLLNFLRKVLARD